MTEDEFGFHEDDEEISEEELTEEAFEDAAEEEVVEEDEELTEENEIPTEEGFTDDNWGDDSDWGFAAGKMFVKAIRSSGYKNAAMALGELIDNSLQAGADNVEVLVSERNVKSGSRFMWNAYEIGVLDDGLGMDPVLLRKSLRLGDGSSFGKEGGMGKFGVGLPQASVSQAQRVDVWSWQSGIESALHTYIDLSDPAWVASMTVPKPDNEPIPRKWLKHSDIDVGETGTLVVWSKVDRLAWKKAKSIYDHSNHLIGRMYRHWLAEDKDVKHQDWPSASIRLISFEDDGEIRSKWEYTANDPMYLMSKTSAPNTIPGRTMKFEPYGVPIVKTYDVHHEDGTTTRESVTIRFSLSPKTLREPYNGTDAGKLDYGKHAKDNIGVSIVRAGRELELSQGFNISKDPRNRWWGAEIEFERGMDDIFGVTNNKQHAENLSDASETEWSDESEGETEQETRIRLKEEDFALFVCMDVAHEVRKNIATIMRMIATDKTSSKSGKSKRSRHADSPERKGTEATKKRKEDTGIEGESDPEETLDTDEKKAKLKQFLEDMGVDDDDVRVVTGDIVDEGLKYSITDSPMKHNPAFFAVDSEAGAVIITLNRAHAAYEKLFSTLSTGDLDKMTSQELHQMILRANSALQLMLIGWARLEDEAVGNRANAFRDARNDWGTITRDFLTFGEDDS